MALKKQSLKTVLKSKQVAKKKPTSSSIQPARYAVNDEELQSLLDALDLTPETVLKAAGEQPVLFMDAARYRVGRMERRVRAKAVLETGKAECALRMRREAEDNGEKITEGKIGNLIDADAVIITLRANYEDAEVEDEFSKLLLEAFRVRRDCIRVISDLTGAERAIESLRTKETVELDKARRKARDKYSSMGSSSREDFQISTRPSDLDWE